MTATHLLPRKKICLIGGGPAALFMLKRFVEAKESNLSIDIFEIKDSLGKGMPYSEAGATLEHVTNVSGNEIPEMQKTLEEWIKKQPLQKLQHYNINPETFNEYRVVPRLLFGEYLADQFSNIIQQAKQLGIIVQVHLNTAVVDLMDDMTANMVTVVTDKNDKFTFHTAIICTGHRWPTTYEGKVTGYYDSPYPPAKLQKLFDHPVALRGSSLTAIDAIRTLARQAGQFTRNENNELQFNLSPAAQNFRVVMHSRSGLLPALRFHLEDPHLSKNALLTPEQLQDHRQKTDGFISLDFVFENNFKHPLRMKDPILYEVIKDMDLEKFVAHFMTIRETVEPFTLFKAEYRQAEKSIRKEQSIYWKELLATLSVAMNYPAKYFSAEDMQRLQKNLMPLISIVIAFVPQSSAEELLALHGSGLLQIVPVGDDSKVKVTPQNEIFYNYMNENQEPLSVKYQTFIDCVGQPHLAAADFPFKTLITDQTVSSATLKFRSSSTALDVLSNEAATVKKVNDDYYLKVSGIAMNDQFQVVDAYGAANPRIYIMAVPYIGGYNPDYSGLDFCEEASGRIIESIIS